MKPELLLLLWTLALSFSQRVVGVIGAQMQVGLPMLAGNRENMPPLIGWARLVYALLYLPGCRGCVPAPGRCRGSDWG